MSTDAFHEAQQICLHIIIRLNNPHNLRINIKLQSKCVCIKTTPQEIACQHATQMYLKSEASNALFMMRYTKQINFMYIVKHTDATQNN